MFPKSIFFLLFFMIMDLILKSIRDKKKIQEEKARDTKAFKGKTSREIGKVPERQKTSFIKSENSLEMQPLEEPLLETRDGLYNGIQDKIDIKRKSSENNKVFQLEKEEILKGIIYSEILSKPKSLRK